MRSASSSRGRSLGTTHPCRLPTKQQQAAPLSPLLPCRKDGHAQPRRPGCANAELASRLHSRTRNTQRRVATLALARRYSAPRRATPGPVQQSQQLFAGPAAFGLCPPGTMGNGGAPSIANRGGSVRVSPPCGPAPALRATATACRPCAGRVLAVRMARTPFARSPCPMARISTTPPWRPPAGTQSCDDQQQQRFAPNVAAQTPRVLVGGMGVGGAAPRPTRRYLSRSRLRGMWRAVTVAVATAGFAALLQTRAPRCRRAPAPYAT